MIIIILYLYIESVKSKLFTEKIQKIEKKSTINMKQKK